MIYSSCRRSFKIGHYPIGPVSGEYQSVVSNFLSGWLWPLHWYALFFQ